MTWMSLLSSNSVQDHHEKPHASSSSVKNEEGTPSKEGTAELGFGNFGRVADFIEPVANRSTNNLYQVQPKTPSLLHGQK